MTDDKQSARQIAAEKRKAAQFLYSAQLILKAAIRVSYLTHRQVGNIDTIESQLVRLQQDLEADARSYDEQEADNE